MYYCMFEYLLCSLYFSTLLTNLNTREFIRGQDEINTFSGIPGIATTVTTSRTRTTGDTLILRGMSQPKSSVPASDMFIKVQRERDVEMMDESDSYKQSKV
ncbi:hypothetical protein H0H81_001450 [Sphagnurus paluster]|uniref:Uncharacterized protein n=1 Tax=Sphagnurus paluster TaxID=117069 RepID=A0A9P7K480_9AGAR|nr:hypothetical protein H0H81_001450 [Sphagnurus paluster]